MVRPLSIIAVVLIICSSCDTPSVKQSFDDLKVLEGKWQTIEGPEFIEVWEIKNDSLLSGIGLSMNGSDTSFKETLKIFRTNHEIFYTALVGSNDDLIYFRLEKKKQNYWMFVNPEHDYPNIIEYKLLNDSTLQAKTMNIRRKKEIKFVMKKVE